MKEEEALVRAVRVVRGSRNSNGVTVVFLTAKGAKTANKKGSVLCSPEEVPEGEGGKVKRSVRSNSNREIRESLYCLFLLVRAVRVIRGS